MPLQPQPPDSVVWAQLAPDAGAVVLEALPDHLSQGVNAPAANPVVGGVGLPCVPGLKFRGHQRKVADAVGQGPRAVAFVRLLEQSSGKERIN